MRKFRKSLALRLNILLVMCIVLTFISLLSLLSFSTEAKFLNKANDSFSLQAGHWWDGSSLAFLAQPNAELQACPQPQLSFFITNKGFTMLDTTTYQLYHSIADSPSENGDVIEEGTIPRLS